MINRERKTPSGLVSAAAYAAILTTPYLRRLLLPAGLLPSPYAALEYHATLFLHDAGGVRATFARQQTVRIQQTGVGAILDHAWGDGVLLTDYQTDAGSLVTTLRDGDHRHLVLALRQPLALGTAFTFRIRRTAMVAFTRADEWLTTTVDHPIGRLTKRVVFPVDRPCQQARLVGRAGDQPLPVQRLADDRTVITVVLPQAQAHHPYTVRWSW